MRKFRKSFSDSQGFTMIELLIVIAIIGILAAFAIPKYFEYKTRAYSVESKSNLRYLFHACQAYWIDNGSSSICDQAAVAQAWYNFVPSPHVTLTGSGTETNFIATVAHNDSTVSYTINSKGQIY